MNHFWKNKKIVVYIALAHHTKFLLPVVEVLKKKGARIIYVVGQAERSQEMTAIEKGLGYTHVFDYVTTEDEKDVDNNYCLQRDHFAKALCRDFSLATSPLTVIDKTLYAAAKEYVGFRNLLAKERPDLCFALHEINRWGKMLAFWSKKQNTPCITFQEGLGYNLDFGYTGQVQYSTLALVWGKRIKKKLASYEAPAQRIIPVGNTHLSREIHRQERKNIRTRKRDELECSKRFAVLLFLSSALPSPDLFLELFSTMSKNRKLTPIVKFHPATKVPGIQKWIEAFPAHCRKGIRFIHVEEDTYDLISASDLCVLAQTSTTGLEALAFGKPLVELDLNSPHAAPYSFADQHVAFKMTPKKLGEALNKGNRFKASMKPVLVEQYLKNELSDMDQTLDLIQDISQKVIQATHTHPPSPLSPVQKPGKKWSIVLPVTHDPDLLLFQLESLATFSENCGSFETILLEPIAPSKKIEAILESLTGDLVRLAVPRDKNLPHMMNLAGQGARGKNLIFLSSRLVPLPGWLKALGRGIQKHGRNKLFGGRITDNQGKIIHAGMVVDTNSQPVSAYIHTRADFPPALKERPFQIVDLLAAMERDLFLKVGGFSENSGGKAFMDLSLTMQRRSCADHPVIYLPKLHLTTPMAETIPTTTDDIIYFSGRWTGALWPSESKLYHNDGVNQEKLAGERMAAARAGLVL